MAITMTRENEVKSIVKDYMAAFTNEILPKYGVNNSIDIKQFLNDGIIIKGRRIFEIKEPTPVMPYVTIVLKEQKKIFEFPDGPLENNLTTIQKCVDFAKECIMRNSNPYLHERIYYERAMELLMKGETELHKTKFVVNNEGNIAVIDEVSHSLFPRFY